MRRWVFLPALTLLASCAAEPKRPAAGAVEIATQPPPDAAGMSHDGCIVVVAEQAAQPTSVEGVLSLTKDGKKGLGASPFVLRLTRPRCIVGLEHGSFITEVYVASTGMDLRPLLDARIRVRGDAIGGNTDQGAAAVVVFAKQIERVKPGADPADP